MSASGTKHTDDSIPAASSHYWISDQEFKAQTHKLLDEALGKHGSIEFENATTNTTGDAWEKYMELKRKLRYQKPHLEYPVDPYHVDDNLQLTMHNHSICEFNDTCPLARTSRSWRFTTRKFPAVRNELNVELVSKVVWVKGLQQKLELFESMSKIFLNVCGCESCNNRKRVVVKDCHKCSNCKANSQVKFKVDIGCLVKTSSREWNCRLSTIESYRSVRFDEDSSSSRHTVKCKEYGYTDCFKSCSECVQVREERCEDCIDCHTCRRAFLFKDIDEMIARIRGSEEIQYHRLLKMNLPLPLPSFSDH